MPHKTNTKSVKNSSIEYLQWVFWGCSAIFFFYEFLLRILPSVMVDELMATFRVEAGALGNLSAFYFYIYAPMQFLVGLLVDRFGAKTLLWKAVLCCGVGAIFFGLSTHLGLAEFARVLMGFGSAFAFVSMIYIASHHLPGKHLSLLIGVGNSIGMLGAFVGEGPLFFAIDSYGWRVTSIWLGAIGITLSTLIFVLYRIDYKPERGHSRRASSMLIALKNLKSVLLNPWSWLNSFVSLCLYATTTAFAGLWCIPFLKTAHHFTADEAGFASSMIFLGWIFGGPLIGYFSKGRIKIPILLSSIAAFFCLSPVIYMTNLSTLPVFILLFFTGFFSASQLLTFHNAIKVNPIHAKGSALAFTNFLVMIAGAILQPLVGYLLQQGAYIDKIHDVPVYTTVEYQSALSVFPASFILAFLLTLALKEGIRHASHTEKTV